MPPPPRKKPKPVVWIIWAECPDEGFVSVAEIAVPTRFITDRPTAEQIAALRETYGTVVVRRAADGFPADLMGAAR